MNDYVNNGATTELFAQRKHPLAVKPETVKRFGPKHLRYALTPEARERLTKKGIIGPTRESTAEEIKEALRYAASQYRVQLLRAERIKKRFMEQINKKTI